MTRPVIVLSLAVAPPTTGQTEVISAPTGGGVSQLDPPQLPPGGQSPLLPNLRRALRRSRRARADHLLVAHPIIHGAIAARAEGDVAVLQVRERQAHAHDARAHEERRAANAAPGDRLQPPLPPRPDRVIVAGHVPPVVEAVAEAELANQPVADRADALARLEIEPASRDRLQEGSLGANPDLVSLRGAEQTPRGRRCS